MKRVLAVGGVMLLMAFTMEREDTEGWKIYELRGKVRSLEQKKYSAVLVDGKIQKGKRALQWFYDSDFRIQFTDKGKVVEEEHFKSDDQPEYHIQYFYDAKAKLIEDHYRDEDGVCKMFYYYDQKGRILREISFEPDSVPEFEITYQYRQDSVFSEKIWNDPEGKENKRIVHKFDSRGRDVEMSAYDQAGNLTYWRTKKYDVYGNLIESASLEEGTIRKYKTSYVMDSKRRIVETTSWFGSEKEKIKSSYDNRGNCIREEKYVKGDILYGYTNYQFDENNTMIKRESVIEGEVVESMEWIYEYDQKKNWISCTHLTDKKPTLIVERKLTYY